jgi:hypothetical protein
MELDDLKQTFRDFDRRLAQQSALAVEIRKDQRVSRVRASLRPLVLGHAAQVAVGVLVVLFAGRAWVDGLGEPHLLIAGGLVHGYAVLMIALGAQMLWAMHRLDFAAPILVIQKQLALVRRSYVRSGLVIGLPWWFLWIPFAILLLDGAGIDFYASASRAWLAANLAVSVVGIGGTLWLTRAIWRKPREGEPTSERELRMSGASLRRAQRVLDEIAQFEKE